MRNLSGHSSAFEQNGRPAKQAMAATAMLRLLASTFGTPETTPPPRRRVGGCSGNTFCRRFLSWLIGRRWHRQDRRALCAGARARNRPQPDRRTRIPARPRPDHFARGRCRRVAPPHPGRPAAFPYLGLRPRRLAVSVLAGCSRRQANDKLTRKAEPCSGNWRSTSKLKSSPTRSPSRCSTRS